MRRRSASGPAGSALANTTLVTGNRGSALPTPFLFALEETGLERRLGTGLDPVGARALASRDDLAKLGADVVKRRGVVRRDPGRKAAFHELAIARPPTLLA